MNRYLQATAVLFLVFAFSGCACNAGSGNGQTPAPPATAAPTPPAGSAAPGPTPAPETASPAPTGTPGITVPATNAPGPGTPEPRAPEPSPTPAEPTPEPTETIPAAETYASDGLGLTFTVPGSWADQYRVEEGDGYLSVYFTPAESPGKSSRSGELFSVAKAHTAVDGQYISGEWEFTINGTTYAWGVFDRLAYGASAPEYDTYRALQNDIPAIFETVRSISGQAPDSSKRIWIETIPRSAGYETTMGLGIAITLPDRWIGRCRIVEREDVLSFYFKPEEPVDASIGDGFLFCILRKTPEDDAAFMDGVLEFEVDGVAYVSGTSTDASYTPDLPDYDTYRKMAGDRQEIIDSARAIP